MREIRVYMLTVACSACLMRIGMTVAENFNMRMGIICVENFAFDLASHLSSFWS